jgi:superoxide reductase
MKKGVKKMMEELFQTADWKQEKHVPVIEAKKEDDGIDVKVSVGKEIAHPNTTEHHISWIDVLFKPSDSKFPFHVARTEFKAHGASTQGPNTSTIYSQPKTKLFFNTDKPGKVIAFSYCNIHGLWANSVDVE